ncbi:MAG: ABC transporter permease [Gemmatimonadales bacterium]|nr:ABC transporter permease [Gemmatimonadales bacterium]
MSERLATLAKALAAPAAALALGLVLLAAGLAAAGYDARAGLAAMADGAFGSWYAFTSATLVRAVPLVLIGLGFALALRAGALNIGGEGQFLAGAIAAAWLGVALDGWPSVLAAPLGLLGAALAGALWMALPVLLRARYGVLEVISTLLLNFVAEALVSLMVTGPMQEPTHVYPQSAPIAAAARLPLLPGTRLHLGVGVAIAAAAALAFVLRQTWWGFAVTATGAGARAARVSGGIRTARVSAVALLLAGGLAGLAGGTEVGGVAYALYPNLSPGYGFTAIAVALLARLDPLGIVASGVLFGALEAGAQAMQRDAGIPSVAVYVVEALAILLVLVADAAARRRQGTMAGVSEAAA